MCLLCTCFRTVYRFSPIIYQRYITLLGLNSLLEGYLRLKSFHIKRSMISYFPHFIKAALQSFNFHFYYRNITVRLDRNFWRFLVFIASSVTLLFAGIPASLQPAKSKGPKPTSCQPDVHAHTHATELHGTWIDAQSPKWVSQSYQPSLLSFLDVLTTNFNGAGGRYVLPRFQ